MLVPNTWYLWHILYANMDLERPTMVGDTTGSLVLLVEEGQ